MKKVLLFGIYDPNYSRSRLLTKGFRENGWVVDECRVDPKEFSGLKKYWELWKKGNQIKRNKHDLVIVAFPAQTISWLARIIFGPEIISDAFVSMYDSNVLDRKLYGKYHPLALRDLFFDWLLVTVSKYALLDTHDHIKYYSSTFHLPLQKFIRVLVGSDIVKPPAPNAANEKFTVEFHGTYIPLQGIEYIIRAAHILKEEHDIQFNLVGRGQTYKECQKIAQDLQVKNINFIDKVPFEKIIEYVNNADICLGIFGSTPKTLRVIPNKVYECAAMGKAIITSDSQGIREVFTDKENIILVPVMNEKAIAEKILLLKKDRDLCKKIAENAYVAFISKCTPKIVVKDFLEDLENKKRSR
jgi:glycosyltransferase involved in cell wall biosynthesis